MWQPASLWHFTLRFAVPWRRLSCLRNSQPVGAGCCRDPGDPAPTRRAFPAGSALPCARHKAGARGCFASQLRVPKEAPSPKRVRASAATKDNIYPKNNNFLSDREGHHLSKRAHWGFLSSRSILWIQTYTSPISCRKLDLTLCLSLVSAVEPLHTLLMKLHVTVDEFSHALVMSCVRYRPWRLGHTWPDLLRWFSSTF